MAYRENIASCIAEFDQSLKKSGLPYDKDNFLSNQKPNKELPALNGLVEKIAMKDIFDEVEAVFGTKGTIGRNAKMYLSQRHTSEKLKDIGACFGIGESDVFQSSRRVKDRIRNDKKHGRKIAKIEKKIIMSRMKQCPYFFFLFHLNP